MTASSGWIMSAKYPNKWWSIWRWTISTQFWRLTPWCGGQWRALQLRGNLDQRNFFNCQNMCACKFCSFFEEMLRNKTLVCHFDHFWRTIFDRQHFEKQGYVKPCIWFQCFSCILSFSAVILAILITSMQSLVSGCCVQFYLDPSESISIQSWSAWIIWTPFWLPFFGKEYKRKTKPLLFEWY